MNSIQLRFIYFLLGCIPSRLLLVWLAKNNSNSDTERLLLASFTLIVGSAFLFLFVTGFRSTGPEVFGAEIWWKPIRIVHAFLYMTYAYSLLSDNSLVSSNNSWIILLLDVVIAVISFLVYHYRSSNFMLLW